MAVNFRFPFDGTFSITSPFGWRLDDNGRPQLHTGCDFACPMQTIIRAAADGTVQYAQPEADAGNTITLRHEGTFESRYHHLASFGVNEGDRVVAGQEIARSNNTGASTGPHLHFEIRTDHATPVDPIPYLIPPPPVPPEDDDMKTGTLVHSDPEHDRWIVEPFGIWKRPIDNTVESIQTALDLGWIDSVNPKYIPMTVLVKIPDAH